jgi:carbonic anhydrase/acetyltransferase-like protein (isoleucine patch superfamily)
MPMVDWLANIREVPETGEDVYIAPTAAVVGKIEIGDFSSLWPNVSARGDENWIRIGKRTNIQDNSVLHVTHDTYPLSIGDEVTVGHGCILHGCTIKDRCLIGMGSVVLDGAEVGPDAMVGAGSVVRQGEIIPPGTLYLGVPARFKRDLSQAEKAAILEAARGYQVCASEYRKLSL